MIICGTDFSRQAAEAVDVAAAIAARRNEELKVVYAYDKQSAEQILASAEDVVLATVRQRLRDEAERARKVVKAVEGEIVTGSPDEALASLAESAHATLLVVAAVGSRSATFWTLGSVAERVARTAPCPVLVVRDAQPFLAWTAGERPLRLVAGIDMTSASDHAVDWIADLRSVGPIDVVYAHIYSPLEEARRIGIPPLSVGEEQADMEAVLERDLRQRLDRAGETNARLLVQMNFGRAADPLVQIAEVERCDLLVVGSHRRTLTERAKHGSVSYTALHLARMSVASVPLRAGNEERHHPRKPLRRVLVVTGSSDANDLIEHAASLVPAGGTLHVLHVISEEPSDDVHRAVSASIPSDLTQGKIVEVEVIGDDDPAEAICQAAERGNADFICIASQARGGILGRASLGSTAEGIIARTRRPVLVVPRSD